MPSQLATNETFAICKKHPEYEVPLIFTFAFPGKDYWCAFCGETDEMFGGRRVERSQELDRRLETYSAAWSGKFNYLHGVGANYSVARMTWKGRLVRLEDLPVKVIEAFEALSRSWTAGVRAEDVDVGKIKASNRDLVQRVSGTRQSQQ